MGQKTQKTHQSKRITEAGYTQELSHYQAKNCVGCPLQGQCFKAKVIEASNEITTTKDTKEKLEGF